MKCRDINYNHPAATLRRTATIISLLLATFGVGSALAQQPLATSPTVSTPYSWPNYHGGGGFLDSGTTGSQYTLPDAPSPFSNPFSWQLMGTATGLDAAGTAQTEIPSFVLGNYNPLLGPSGPLGTTYHNSFRDSTIYNIAGPFVFDDVNIGSAAIVVDDNNTTNTTITNLGSPAADSFKITAGTWTTISSANDITGGTYASATNAEYQSVQVPNTTTATPTATATWIVSPTYNGQLATYTPQPGYYTLSVHVPNVEGATTTTAGTTVVNTVTQVLSTDAHYVVLLNPTQTTNPNAAGYNKIADIRINQATTNTQTLAGPILLAATDKLYVILDNTTLVSAQTASAIPTVVAADSITLQQNTGGDVESAPASVNDTEYNEIRNAAYVGVVGGTTDLSLTNDVDLLPRGNQTITAFGVTNTAASASREIRQLVYFGRLETLPVLTLIGGNVVAARSTTGQVITQQVGAIYCMDGLTGGIVWRYQTPGTYDVNTNQTSASGAVFSSPALARINVRVDPSPNPVNPPYATKLVVVIGDNRGFVYCLDAVGNRDGTSNTDALYQNTTAGQSNYTTDTALVNQPIIDPVIGLDYNPETNGTNQPNRMNLSIYPTAPAFNTFGSKTTPTDPPHEGNTTAYWIYRPDATGPKYVTGTAAQIGTVKTTSDPNSDLPTPGAFGPASPTIYVDGETTTDTTTDVPSQAPNGSANIKLSNAIVYIGNSNGVLYALDALGFPVTQKTSAAGVKYLDSDTTGTGYVSPATGDAFNTVLDVEDKLATATATSTYISTPAPIWWFSIRGAVNSAASTSTADIESAPAVLVEKPNGNSSTLPQDVTVYVTSAHEDDADGNSGRLYALDGNYGPSGDNGLTNLKNSISTNYQGPGSFDYNIGQRPQLPQVVGTTVTPGTVTSDPYHWSFPDEYGQGQSSNKNPRPALGNMYGSPVVFADPNDLATDPIIGGTATHPRVRIYVAANTGPEVPYDATGTNNVAAASDDNTTGRIWAVNIDGSITKTTAASQDNGWSYPKAWDPNDAAHENSPELSPPMGAFLHAAPAIGVVQFPADIVTDTGGTYDPTTDAKYTGGIDGQDVSMLYIATSGQDDGLDNGAGFYSLDIDGLNTTATEAAGTQDNDKEIEAIPSPTGETFVASPALVVNPSTPATPAAGGNGGDVFVTGSNGTLFEFGATPITNNIPGTTGEPYFPVDDRLAGFSPISSPGLTAGSVTDLTTSKTTADARDYLYAGFGNGLCYGITPAGPDIILGGGIDPGSIGPEPGLFTGPAVSQVSNQFQLYTYVADPSSTSGFTPSSTTIPTGASSPTSLAAYEWGDNIYVRISNVIPPAGYEVFDDTHASGDSSVYFTNGGPVTFTLTATSPRGGGTTTTTTPQTIPATVLPASSLPNLDGFFIGTDLNINPDGKLSTDAAGTDDGTNVFIAATSFPVTNQEPGAQQRIVSATQTASMVDPTTGVTTPVVLQATIGQGTQFIDAKTGNLVGEAAATQPTFAILNPLAARGGGVPIAFSAASPQIATPIGQFAGTNAPAADQDGVGPFRGITRPTTATPNTFDLQAFSNGNRVYTTTVPIGNTPITTVGGNTTGGNRRRNRNNAYPQHNVRITTATGEINDGAQGTNADPKSTASFVTGSNADTQNGLSPNSTYGDYTLDFADRSDLGLAGLTLNGLRMDKHVLGWNDNNGLFSTTGPTGGPGAMVNPLPWDTIPTTGSNHSSDYPDISSTAVSSLLKNTNITTQGGTPDGATLISGTNVDARSVIADAAAIQIAVPKYQPANLQFFDQSLADPTPITPEQAVMTDKTFPMGYVARNIRVYVDSNNNGRWDQGEAYRTISVYSGVPVDLNTTISNTTTDLGKLPQGFGLQTEDYPALGYFIPYPTSTAITANSTTPGYTSFFKPLTILNQGNTNLVNVHVDQKLAVFGTTGTTSLPLLGDSLESLATIPSYDGNGAAVPTPTASLPGGNTTEMPYLLRSSLDDDIISAYGRNPGLVAQGAPYNTLGATFHKPRVGDASPSTMTVPDVPHDNNPGTAGDYYLAPNSQVNTGGTVTATLPPVVGSNGGLVTSSTGAGTSPTQPQYPNEPAYGPPYIALAVPQGTPVGTYSQNVRVFEGVNTSTATGQYDPLMPPTYGSAGVVINPYLNTTAPGTMSDTFLRSVTGVPAQPYSTPTVVRATVTEGRITDGSSAGSLPQVDSTAGGKAVTTPTATVYTGSADFLPSAFRDSSTGNVSMYWVSSRYATANTLPPYNVFGANLEQTSNGAFAADTANSRWLSSIGTGGGPLFTNTVASGINSSISITPDEVLYAPGSSAPTTDHSAYAFVQRVIPQGTGAYSDDLLCYEVTPASGVLSSGFSSVTSDPRTAKFGVHGLKFDTTFVDAYPGGTANIGNNLWAFWYSGSGSRSAIYYNSSTANGGAPGTFGTPAVLPVPAGLVSISDPNAVLTYAPDVANSANIDPVIEVTYTGIAADGNSDIYVSRYRPYLVRNAQGTVTTQVGLALVPSPAITEQLQATGGNLYWQARDVGWARNGVIDVVVNGIDLQLNAATAKAPTFDRATGSLVYPNVSPNGSSGGGTPITVYVDLSRGRLRFSRPLVGVGTAAPTVYATFSPQARRITTDPRADSAPVSFIDTSYKANDILGEARVHADRYWYIWRKSGASGTSTVPTLFYKTQRLSIALHDANGIPVTPSLMSATGPATLYPKRLVVTDTATGNIYYDSANTNTGTYTARADIDMARGRVYFPITAFGTPFATEGRSVTIQMDYNDANGNAQTTKYTDTIHWLDEPRFQNVGNPNITTGTTTAIAANATDDAEVPIDTITNEGNVTAFLDPDAYNDTANTGTATTPDAPHKVWLFWTSTRNGTADIYYETIDPLFSALSGQ